MQNSQHTASARPIQLIHCRPFPSLAAQADAERREHLLERSVAGAQHHAEAKMHHPNAGLNGRLRRRFPLLTDVGKKTRTRS